MSDPVRLAQWRSRWSLEIGERLPGGARSAVYAVVRTVMLTVQAWRDDQAELDQLIESRTFRRGLMV